MAEGLNDAGWVQLTIAVPPELAETGVAPDLQRFFDAMVYKLRRNAHKGRWEAVPLDRAMVALSDESIELGRAVVNGSTSEVLMEAADVANQALIVAAIALEAKDAAASPRSPVKYKFGSIEGQRSESDGVTRQPPAGLTGES